MAGTKQTSIRSYNFYAAGTIQGAAPVGTYAENQHDFIDVDDQTPFLSHTVLLRNDGVGTISFRFSPDPGGGAAHGVVLASETLELNFKRSQRIYLSGTVIGSNFRLWAW